MRRQQVVVEERERVERDELEGSSVNGSNEPNGERKEESKVGLDKACREEGKTERVVTDEIDEPKVKEEDEILREEQEEGDGRRDRPEALGGGQRQKSTFDALA